VVDCICEAKEPTLLWLSVLSPRSHHIGAWSGAIVGDTMRSSSIPPDVCHKDNNDIFSHISETPTRIIKKNKSVAMHRSTGMFC
jgi:hypothetical protein